MEIYKIKSGRGLYKILLLLSLLLVYLSPHAASCEETGETAGKTMLVGESEVTGSGDTALPDLFTGAMSYKIPIEMPPGRNGMQPSLELMYNSRGGNSWVGVGWDLEVGAIERSTRSGVDYTKSDYVLRRAGSLSELVYDDIKKIFSSKIETEFMLIQQQVDGSFIATNKLGIKFFFGQTENSRIYGTVKNTPAVFRWQLDRIEDTSGNFITYTYSADQMVKDINGNILSSGQRYLDHIDYNGNIIKFYLEDRSDAPELYTANFLLNITKRLKLIDVIRTDGNRIRTYKLSYNESPATERTILASVQQFGNDAAVDASGTITNESTASKLPAQSFSISNQNNSFSESLWTSISNNWGPDYYTWSGDFNGDGRTDIATTFGSNIYVHNSKILEDNKNTFEEQRWSADAVFGKFRSVGGFIDDGKAGILTHVDGKYVEYISSQNLFQKREVISGMAAPQPRTFIGKFVKDKEGSCLASFYSAGGYFMICNDTYSQGGADTVFGDILYSWVGDFDGDGRDEIATAIGGKIYIKKLILDNSSFTTETWTETANSWGNHNYTWAGDFNGDGRTDIATASGGTIWVKLSKVDHDLSPEN